MKNLTQNFFYQSIFQLTKILIPIITIPIVSKALGPSGIGVYNYTNSITQYFVLFASLGVAIYGNREVAIVWNRDRDNISKVFWEIFLVKAILTILTLILYYSVIIFLDNSLLLFAQSFTLISVLFDISWFFMGIEDFKKTSLVNLLVQVVTFILIYFFIKNSNDVLKYTLIQSIGLFSSQLLVWIFVKKYIHVVKFDIKKSFSHIRGSINFFIPQVAITFYTNLNKTLLGFVLGSSAVAFYTNSLQLNTVFITIITTLDTVLLPYMTGLFAKENIKKIVEIMKKTIDLQLFFSIPIMFGILIVFDKLVPWFFGDEFLFLNKIIPFFSLLVVVIPLGMSISRQYLMPIGKIGEYNKSVIIGAVINITLSLLLIRIIGIYAVIIANITAECFVTLIRIKSFKTDTGFLFNKKRIIIYFVVALFMCLVTRLVTNNYSASLITNFIQFIIATLIYMSLTAILKVNPLFDLIKNKIIF